jgi:hypothetical protein
MGEGFNTPGGEKKLKNSWTLGGKNDLGRLTKISLENQHMI